MIKILPLFFTLIWTAQATAQPFITVWDTTQPGISGSNQITIPTTGTGYSYSIYWVKQYDNSVNGTIAGPITGSYTITFPQPGKYIIYISGDFPRIYFNEQYENPVNIITSDAHKLLTIEQWGNIKWKSMESAFEGCEYLSVPAMDVPDLTQVTNMSFMFDGAMKFNQPPGNWDWNVSKVTNMSRMFHNTAFNQPIGTWDVSKVTDMSSMFSFSNFNQPIGNWNVSNVTNMEMMFMQDIAFNQPIGDWNVSHVSNMNSMFGCYPYFPEDLPPMQFNQSLEKWDVSNVRDMSGMFYRAINFNQPIGNWNVSNVTNMNSMFMGASVFNQPIGNWDVSNVTDMGFMFSGEESPEGYQPNHFNQSIRLWNVSKVQSMIYMFYSAVDFNQPLGDWNILNVRNMDQMLSLSGLDVNNYDQTLIGWASKNVQSSVALGAEGLKFCAGEVARSQLMTTKGWSVTGDIKDYQTLPVPEVSVIQPLCRDSTGTITVSNAPTGIVQYSFDGGVTFQSENMKTGLQPGTYSVIYKSGEGCRSSSTTVEINSPPILAIPVISGGRVVCPNVVAVDYQASISNYTYQWFVNGGVVKSINNNAITVDWGPTNFNASVIAVGLNEYNCPPDTAVFPVKIQIQLQPEILSGPDSVCFNFRTGVPYRASYTNGSVYTWFTDGGTISEGQSTSQAKIDWKDLGKYTLWVKEENTTSTDYCEGFSDTLNVTVFKDLAAITMNFVSVDYKEDNKVQIAWDATLLERISDLIIVSRRIAGSNQPWQVVGSLQKNIQTFLDQNVLTDQNVYEYKVEGFNKCEEGLQTVIHNTIKLEGEKEEAEGIIDLNWNDYNGWEGVERYEIWRKLDNDTTYRLIEVTPGEITNYAGKHGRDGFSHLLRIKAKKMNENTISWSNEIALDFENPIDMIPNVITPDGDDKNEYFVIPRLNLYPDNYLKIINRWGELVYEKRNYQNDWNAGGLQSGTYYYSLHLLRNNNTMNGWVQVVR